MIKNDGAIGLAVLFAAWTTGAVAAEMPMALDQYTHTPEHMAAVMTHVRPYFAVIPSCTPGTAKRIKLIPMGPITFNPDGSLLKGQWREVIKVDGCVNSGLFNVMTVTDAAGAVHVVGLLAGTTIADPQLSRDGIGYAVTTAAALAARKGEPAGCRQINVLDTVFITFGGVVSKATVPGRDPRSWTESWTLKVCATQLAVKMTFVPDATGASVVASE